MKLQIGVFLVGCWLISLAMISALLFTYVFHLQEAVEFYANQDIWTVAVVLIASGYFLFPFLVYIVSPWKKRM